MWSVVVTPGSEVIRPGFSLNNTYKLSVTYDPIDGSITCLANNKLVFSAADTSITGAKVGFRSTGSGAIFTPISIG